MIPACRALRRAFSSLQRAPRPRPTPAPAHFSEVAAASGLHFEMRSGGQVKNYILESKGGGGALLDYDGDGWLDIYLVNGAQLGGHCSSQRPLSQPRQWRV